MLQPTSRDLGIFPNSTSKISADLWTIGASKGFLSERVCVIDLLSRNVSGRSDDRG